MSTNEKYISPVIEEILIKTESCVANTTGCDGGDTEDDQGCGYETGCDFH